MKKILFLFIIIFNFCYSTGFADNIPVQNKVEKLKELEIINGYEDGNFYPENYITRAEFCKMISFVAGGKDCNDAGDVFCDVPVDHWANKYILFCHNNKWVNGKFCINHIGANSDNMFSPDESLTYQDALKILVQVLGYDEFALKRGGYPYGYIKTAVDIGVIELEDNAAYEGYLIRNTAAELIYDSLYIPLMISKDNGNQVEYYIAHGKNGVDFKTLYTKYFQ